MSQTQTLHWKPTRKENLQFNAAAFLLDSISRIQLATVRKIHVNGRHVFDRLRSGEGFIISMWHENIFLASRLLSSFRLTILASASRDGELAVRFAERAGHHCIRGSSSRFGRRALSQLIRLGKAGGRITLMPDGPLGPARKAQAGVLGLAQMSGLPVIPFHFDCTRQYRLGTWDGQKICKLGSAMILGWGDAITVPKRLSADEQQEYLKKIEHAMNENARRTEELSARLAHRPFVPFVPKARQPKKY